MTKCRRSWMLCLLMAGLPLTSASGQVGEIRGLVRDEQQRPIASATVTVPGTAYGTLTGADGTYALEVPAGTYQVEARSIGYAPATETVTVSAGQPSTVDFVLVTQAVELDEVVASVAATAARRVELGTDIERFNADAAVDRSGVTNVSELLNARATGVSVAQSSGTVGGASQIRIRGSTSLTQDNNPIIYLDGIRISNQTGTGPGSYDFGNGQTVSRLDDINPQNIASIQVMKGPTAAALYGSEAAAGVLLIETKQGRAGQHRFSFTTQQGILQDVTDYPDNYYNLTQFGGFTDIDDPVIQQFRPIVNPATGDIYARHSPLENPLTSPLRTGHTQAYTLGVQGGSEAITYFSSLQYEDQSGTLPNNTLERYSFRANVEASPRDDIDVVLSSAFIGTEVRLPDNDRSAVGMLTNAGAGLPLFSRGVRADGTPGDCLATLISGLPESLCDARQGNLTASFDKLATIRNTQDVGRGIAGLQFHWRPTGWLTQRISGGVDYIQTENVNFVPLDPDRPFGPDSDGVINDERITHQTLTLDYAMTAETPLWRGLAGSTTLGAQYFSTRTERVGCSGSGGFASNTATACDAALFFTGFSDRLENVEVGALLQQHLGYNDYLFATGGVRVDDNSAFGENEDAIWSPSVNLSALVSDMPWWRIDRDLVNNLRLRFAWGTAAQAPAPFAHARTLEPVRLASPTGGQLTGVSLLDPGNPDLTAERNEEWEIGFDSRLFSDRIGVKATYYNQTTTDAIVQTSVAPSTGFSGAKFVNIGEVANEGIEVLLDAQVLARENLLWEVEAKLSTQDPVITSLGGQQPILFGLETDYQMFREGFAPGAYFGVVVESAERDASGDIIPGSVVLAPGNLGDPNYPNHVYLGRAAPANEQSLSTTLTLFENLRLYTLFDRAGGFAKYDSGARFRSPFLPERTGSRIYAFRKAESTPEEQAMLEMGAEAQNAVFIEDASFVKWREVTLSYGVPAELAARWFNVETASITLGGRNLYTWTEYSGLDPELRYDGGSDSFAAAEFFTQPPTRNFFIRLNLTF